VCVCVCVSIRSCCLCVHLMISPCSLSTPLSEHCPISVPLCLCVPPYNHHAVTVLSAYPLMRLVWCVCPSDHHSVYVYTSWYHPALWVPPYLNTVLYLYHYVCVYALATSKQFTIWRQWGMNVTPLEATPMLWFLFPLICNNITDMGTFEVEATLVPLNLWSWNDVWL
jgi:hypothetical protein